ncbi:MULTISPECIES: hypothetical protein [unclassified Paenibacillus]|uniref:hypothetical protein n=1 Tax=unclassified Paenibacillus TaxID=185978 RepID=UPI002405BE31|nr:MULTISPECIES: hypothetical protein [unclassified Paenibacillus]MDF9839905.1 hypothetical protein [Paenibacillus sp. PastF-2]MDF9846487.1 hypothetical protein [Paenibacillus sp. PastM-2]MDF9853165.1 hypothetical protein [Paenibacillus sp. PastF-1]MDH6478331.1 hypothetical protein [Paenibacillus sp. PastH-2]MDH6506171.1 hypothetical protein [Paenibacillus sp. PastM-3]
MKTPVKPKISLIIWRFYDNCFFTLYLKDVHNPVFLFSHLHRSFPSTGWMKMDELHEKLSKIKTDSQKWGLVRIVQSV